MAVNMDPILQLDEVDLVERDGFSNEFFQLAAQLLANNPAPKTRDTHGRELRFFISWYGKDGSIANITFKDLLRYKVMLESQYSSATVMKKIAAIKSLFRFVKRIRVINENPAEELRVAGPIKDRVPTHLAEDEVQGLIKMPDRRTILGKKMQLSWPCYPIQEYDVTSLST